MYNKVRLKLNNYLSNGDQQPELQDGIRKDKKQKQTNKIQNTNKYKNIIIKKTFSDETYGCDVSKYCLAK